jgi:hypothetical protein
MEYRKKGVVTDLGRRSKLQSMELNTALFIYSTQLKVSLAIEIVPNIYTHTMPKMPPSASQHTENALYAFAA